ncbi:MAG: hypothetical protein ACHP7O_08955 [Burkholderiales bacterium]
MNRYQRGQLSLLWCAILVGLCTALAFAGLFSMRYERNLFAEGWAYVQNTLPGRTVLRAPSAAVSATTSVLKGQKEEPDRAANTVIRKCRINGSLVYSNVDCRHDNPTSRIVEWHDSRGFESPKAAAAATPQPASSDTLEQKAMDKAIENATGNQGENQGK